ncbi:MULTISPECIES: glycoside hydrolase domain-containing protein [Helcococcus]|uniref:Glycoside hydrolase domain-containing protein n=1 Tax=Helcococcus bovis TaxID=3153252 RepID=A0ABW9F533_9FIRM
MDLMVLETQQWLNKTYGQDNRYEKVKENGKTGWPTIDALTLALQIELGIQNTATNFGPTTIRLFNEKFPKGVKQQNDDDKSKSNIYSIIQGALWCKGYSTGSHITQNFYNGTGKAIKELKSDMGLGGDSTVTVDIIEALLSMKQFVLLWRYGGSEGVRIIQQKLNRDYPEYLGIIPTDGLYGREMNTALIKVLQAEQGFKPNEATGYFGKGTKSRLKVLTEDNYKSYLGMFKVAYYALHCLGYGAGPLENSWTFAFAQALNNFQTDYGLEVTSRLDINTWMSLLTSRGNPDRKVTACDTRFEITDALLKKLKSDGYQIVGRYLTGGDFKEIRDGELQRIIDGGMKYFPIFQESARKLSDFSYQIGLEHGRKASIAALEKGVPNTVIYFAVDMDILDYQIDSHIIPYFRGINESIDYRYQVGIYASRNVCTRVANVGLSVSSFVADMSTGFSGNLGFRIPSNWNYDQIYEISGYGGKWDLDKVAYSGRIPACAKVEEKRDNYIEYTLPTRTSKEELKQYTKIQDIYPLIKDLQDAYQEYIDINLFSSNKALYNSSIGALQYIAKPYFLESGFIKGIGFSLVTSIAYDTGFDLYMKITKKNLMNKLSPYINGDKKIWDGYKYPIDLPHLAVTTLTYKNFTLNPSSWNGWAGDLVSAYSYVRDYYNNNPSGNLRKIARAYIGGSYPRTDLKPEPNTKYNPCSFIDLCSDGFAINLANNLEKDLVSSLNKTFTSTSNPFIYILEDIGVENNIVQIREKVKDITRGFILDLLSRLENNFTDSPEEIKEICVDTFARYLNKSI